jgi:hypothetical protein
MLRKSGYERRMPGAALLIETIQHNCARSSITVDSAAHKWEASRRHGIALLATLFRWRKRLGRATVIEE